MPMPPSGTNGPQSSTAPRLDPSFEKRAEIPRSLVWIGPEAGSATERQRFLSRDRYRITFVKGTLELALLKPSEPFVLALLSDALGSVALGGAALHVRRNWPGARILILGQAAVLLEDNLYDDAIPHACSEEEAVAILERHSGPALIHGRPFLMNRRGSDGEPRK